MNPLPPRPVSLADKVNDFDCGNLDINEWLAKRALNNERRGISRTMVSTGADTGQIAGFYSLSAWSIDRRTISGWLARNSPDPIPVILLGQLSTSIEARGIGLGVDLLTHAVNAAHLAASVLGARALVTEAIDDSAGEFYAHLGLIRVTGRKNLYALSLH